MALLRALTPVMVEDDDTTLQGVATIRKHLFGSPLDSSDTTSTSMLLDSRDVVPNSMQVFCRVRPMTAKEIHAQEPAGIVT